MPDNPEVRGALPSKRADLPRRTSELLATFPERFTADSARFDEVLRALGRRGFAGLLLVLVAPQFVPWPYGFSNLIATPLVPVAGQMALGRREVWLPRWLMGRRIKRRRLLRITGALVPLLRRLEQVVRPRMRFVATPAGERLIGVSALVLSIALVVPVPVVSWLTATAMLVLALGLIERDGLAVLVGIGLGGLAVAVIMAALFGALRMGQVLLG